MAGTRGGSNDEAPKDAEEERQESGPDELSMYKGAQKLFRDLKVKIARAPKAKVLAFLVFIVACCCWFLGSGLVKSPGSERRKKMRPRARFVEAPDEAFVHHFPSHGLTIKSAYASRRGYYPNNARWKNQDSYCLIHNYCGQEERVLMGVFDGHGSSGAGCSQFAGREISSRLERHLLDGQDVGTAHSKAFVSANSALHRNKTVDDSLSGTTAITVLLDGVDLTVANVGDSRAILGQRGQDGKVVSKKLSVDQTPFRKDELDRVRMAGGRVQTSAQVEGLVDLEEDVWSTAEGAEESHTGDTPRVWLTNINIPGLAMTRSVGDFAVEKVGVYAEPEIISRKLDFNCKAIIVASDGVFEFLSSQTVVDMALAHADPLEGAYAIVKESKRQWLRHDVRSDDITVVIALLEWQ
uniref:protein-serine/threonine phosphatase n=1 Tax=Chloropicon primus TaxID=1764295 RepID=A0A7S2SXC6_9CHLO|mmetsp:Transcript_10292/g.29146  ORF Transcript_10292/g.29146 Transcript_10292/m.29146 type:complete len:410 (+) Transcript_10292:587-1816(+)